MCDWHSGAHTYTMKNALYLYSLFKQLFLLQINTIISLVFIDCHIARLV